MAYDLEYGKSVIEIHKDAIKPSEKYLSLMICVQEVPHQLQQNWENLIAVQSLLFFISLSSLW